MYSRNFAIFFLFLSSCLLCPVRSNSILEKCGDGFQEISDCLQYKALKMLDRLILIKNPIPVANFVYLTHDSSKYGNENETAKAIAAEEKEFEVGKNKEKLTETLMKRITDVAKAKSLQFSLDPAVEEGRGKGGGGGGDKKGKGGGMMIMMMMGAMMMHKAMALIGAIAGKALIVAKISLVLSAVIGLKKLLSHDDHESTQAQVIYAKTDGHSGGWQHRSMDDVHAHNMAYSAHTNKYNGRRR